MSPLIEEARRRQRRRRIALGALVLAAAVAAALVAVLQRAPDRQAQPKRAAVVAPVLGGYVVSPRLVNGAEVVPVLRSVAAGVARRYAKAPALTTTPTP